MIALIFSLGHNLRLAGYQASGKGNETMQTAKMIQVLGFLGMTLGLFAVGCSLFAREIEHPYAPPVILGASVVTLLIGRTSEWWNRP